MNAKDIALFLYKGEGLNKTAIGELIQQFFKYLLTQKILGDYLGEKNEFNEQVLKSFVELHDFTNLILVQALRQFLWSFRLPGEAQKIDRMMECFAQRYCQLNPDIFTNTDTCYVLSFSIIMLNTSLHNPSVSIFLFSIYKFVLFYSWDFCLNSIHVDWVSCKMVKFLK